MHMLDPLTGWMLDPLAGWMLDPLAGLLGDGMHAWAIATAAVVAAGCGLVGTLLVVRRMSLMGDAISHAVLPGIVLAVLAGGRPGGPLVLVGAVVAALVTVWLTELFRTRGGLAEDAGVGVAFTTLFALGVVLATAAASRVDLDPGCVLYGVLELVPFDTVSIGGLEVPRAFVTAAVVLAAVLLAAVLTWPLQVFTAFDPEAARAAGVPVAAVTQGLLAATALVTVAGFETVGAILVVAMLVVPAASAELLTHRLHRMAALAVVLGSVAAALGYLLAWRCNTNAAGMIAVVLGAQYALCLLLAPDRGLVARLVNSCWFQWRVRCEDELAACWRAEEAAGGGVPVPPSPPRGLADGLALAWLAVTGQVLRGPRGWLLSPAGRSRATTVVRSHRLWEAWLGRHAHLPLDHLHPPAEWIEHHLGADVRRRIEDEVGRETSDPHGRSIPPES
jgi:manganese/zinc/iron transport system permease protein